MKKISVCIATYNGERFISEQLDSIIPQLTAQDEIIISDDCSTDRTLSIIESYADDRIKVYKNKFGNIVKNFEFALRQSTGDIIFLADQDDIWDVNKVKSCCFFLGNCYHLVLSDCVIFNSASKEILHPSFFNFNCSKPGLLNNLIKNSYIGCCMAFTKEVKNKALPFPEDLPMHDSWIGLIAELFYRVKFTDEKLVSYRKHNNNASYTSAGKSQHSFITKITFRTTLIKNLLKKFLKTTI